MKFSTVTALAGILAALMLSGCATSVSTLDPDLSAFTLQNNEAATKTAYIRSVKDKRVFAENAPANMPTWSNDGSHEEARAVGRKRTGFGRASGGLVLPEGQTAAGVVKSALSQALIDNGYKVIDDKDQVTEETRVLDVDMDQFWNWIQMGFWTLAVNGDMKAKVQSAGQQEPVTVEAHVTRRSVAVTDNSWLRVLNETIQKFYQDARDKLKF